MFLLRFTRNERLSEHLSQDNESTLSAPKIFLLHEERLRFYCTNLNSFMDIQAIVGCCNRSHNATSGMSIGSTRQSSKMHGSHLIMRYLNTIVRALFFNRNVANFCIINILRFADLCDNLKTLSLNLRN